MPARWGNAAVLALALAIKTTVALQLRGHLLLQPAGGLDSEWYVTLARQAAAGDWLLGSTAFFVSPLYVYVLAALLAIGGGSLDVALAAQVLFGVAGVWLVMRTAALWYGEAAGVLAGLLVTLAGIVTFHEVLFLQSALDPVLVAGLAYVFARALAETEKWGREDFAAFTHSGGPAPAEKSSRPHLWWAGTGFVGGLFALNRPNALLVLGAVLVVTAVDALRRRTRVAGLAAAWCLAGTLLALAPGVIRTLAVSGQLSLVSSHGGLNFYIGNHAGADGTYVAPPGITPSIAGQVRDTRRVAEAAAGRALSDGEVSRYFTGLGLAWWRSSPGEALALFGRKLWLLVQRTELALNYSYAYYAYDEPTILAWLPLGAWCLLPLGAGGLFVRPPDRMRAAYARWRLLLPLYGVSVAIFFVSGRYRLPLLVLAAITGAGLLVAAARAGSQRAWRGLLPLVPAAAVAVLSFWPLGLDDGRLEEQTAMAAALAGAGQRDAAVARAAAVARVHPQPGTVHYRVGRALQDRGELAAAEAELRRAASIDRDQPEVHFSLGQVLVARGRPRDALPHLLRASAGGVQPARTLTAIADAALTEPDPTTAVFVLSELGRRATAEPDMLDAIGRRLLEARRGDLAEPYYLALERRFREHAGIAEGLGLALLVRASPRRARVALERAAALDPASPSVALNLAVACVQVEDLESARSWVARALALRPDYPQALSLQSALTK